MTTSCERVSRSPPAETSARGRESRRCFELVAAPRSRTECLLVMSQARYRFSSPHGMVERVGIEPTGSNLARITRLPRARPMKTKAATSTRREAASLVVVGDGDRTEAVPAPYDASIIIGITHPKTPFTWPDAESNSPHLNPLENPSKIILFYQRLAPAGPI